jgi:conjugal transfer/entry exclusion protein
MLKRLNLSLFVVLLSVNVAHAQIPVVDVSNLSQNTISAIQSVLTTIQTVLIELNQIKELLPLDDIQTASGIAHDMALLGELVEQAEGLSYDIGSIQAQIDALFGLDTAPDTRDGLTERIAEIKQLKYKCYSYAARVQTLLRRVIRTIDHLTGLLDTVGAIIGNKQGNQVLAQAQTVTAKHATNIDMQMSSYQRAKTVDKLAEALILESIEKIERARMEDWPSW